jgi:eukaryotic-like serine/threonine-protein kinase
MAVASILPATRIGNYEILSSLGSGGMGVVYKARDLKLQRTVALKFLSADAADQERVLREARAASVLDHNNIVAIHSVEQAPGGAWFLVMAYYEGQTLQEMLRDGALPPARAASIAAQVARGLAHAHSRGLIHHDIKPANIVLTGDGTAKIVDFGLAHRFDMTASTQSVNFSGTLAYMPPEQIQGGALDARSDIWSLGVVFYQMLTGRIPFQGRSAAEQIWSVLHTLPPAMTGVPDALQLVVLRALAKLPNQRYATCQDLLDDLAKSHIERRAASDHALDADLERAAASASSGSRSRHRMWRVIVASAVLAFVFLFALPTLQVMPEPVARSGTSTSSVAHRLLAEGLFGLASAQESAGGSNVADIYQYAADLNPGDSMGYHKLAAYHYRQRDYERAIEVWRHVLLLNPTNPAAHSNIGSSFLKLNRLKEAEEELHLALGLNPDYGAYSNLGMLYYQQKHWAESSDAYEKALKIKATDWRVWGNLGLALEWLNQTPAASDAYARELTLLEAAVDAEPENAILQSKLGWLYSRQHRAPAAIAATNRARARAPNDPDVLVNAAETYENLGNRARAVGLVSRSLEHGKTLDELDHNPGFRRLLVDPAFRAMLAQHTRNLAAASRR